MEFAKYKKFLKEESYAHCTICANYRNINSFGHRKSESHQAALKAKLRKISLHLSLKSKSSIVIHDAHWPQKDCKRFCHFCGTDYAEHHAEDEFTIEYLGSLYHYACSNHSNAVKAFLKRNYRKENVEKYCIKKEDFDCYLMKLPEAKKRYLRKMDLLNDMVLKQIRDSEEKRILLVSTELETPTSSNHNLQDIPSCINNGKEIRPQSTTLNSMKNKDVIKVPPWLEDIPAESLTSENQSTRPVIGPTMDTLVKHVANQKKKGLSKKRIGANFKHQAQGSSTWLPSYQGVWNQGHRKQFKTQFNRRNKKFSL